MKFNPLTLAILLGPIAAPAAAQQPPSLPDERDPVSEEKLLVLIERCEMCHGPGGSSPRDEIPAISGRPAHELMEQLEEYYFYERHCPDVAVENTDGDSLTDNMCRVTGELNRSEALALSRYFEGIDPEDADTED